ncbi:MAG: ADP-ribosylation factor-like protein [Promethearchaeota archaeon]
MNTQKNKESSEDSIKILLVGLDNSGKTSIATCLKGIKTLTAFNSIYPTRGRQIDNFEALNSKYAIWDLGGQKSFREEYFKEFKNYVIGARKIIYVIDIQDVHRYDEAIEYLESVINSIENQGEIEFSIFLHKFDPDIQFDNELNNTIITKLINTIKKKIPTNFDYTLHKTSVYCIFEKTTIS